MSTSYIRYPSASGGVATYANFAAFPATAPDGTLALALDTDILYAYNVGSASWVEIGGPGAALSLGNLDSEAQSAKAANLVGGILAMQSATGSFPGVVNTTTQSFGGNKTFTGTLAASNLSGTNTGDVTLGTANGLSLTLQALSLGLSSTSTTGALSSTDWNTFNNKQPNLGFTPENAANKGAANGYAPLDGAAKVPYANLPSALMTFKGAWDPTTNTPTLTNGVGQNGDVYRASVGGVSTSPIADTWFAGDFIIYNGTVWQRSPLADGVISVNGLSGAVTLTQGNLTDAGTDGITVTGGTNAVWGSGTSLAQHVADTTHNGYLSSTDWNTFNGKQAAGNYITALTGDVTASGPGSVAATLATVNSNTGSFGSSTSIPTFTVNGKGLITAASGNAVIAPAGTLSGTTLNSTVVSSSLTSLGTITTGVWNGTTIAIANGGTGQTTKSAAFDALSPMTTGGDIIYGGASGTGTRLANGSAGQVLTSNGTTLAPTWTTVSTGSLTYSTTTSSTKTVVHTNDWLQFTGNSIVLGAGTWLLTGTVNFSNNGSGPAYNECGVLWGTANGADTGSQPTTVTTLSGYSARVRFNLGSTGGTFNETQLSPGAVIVSGSQTVYLNANVGAGTVGNTQVTAYFNAIKIA